MKKKFLLVLAMLSFLVCLLAISVSAASLSNYASVKLTLVDGTEATGYCVVDGSFQRDTIYKNPENTDDGTYAWEDIKIFDMRNTVIVGSKSFNDVRGINCNGKAVNVEEFYFSSQVTKILNTSFTSGWKSLKTVYIPKSVTHIDSSFQGSPVHEVILEEGSQLKTIAAAAFRDCPNLTSFDFPEGLESLGYNCFFQSGLSGTVVIPNSVTYLGPGALLSTKIENLYLGDGILEIGHNFLGTFGRTDNAYLKNVYMSASTVLTIKDGSKIFYKCKNPVNFYIVGTEKECAAMVETLKSHSTGSYMTFITASEATESTGSGYGIIYTGYNRCDAFYGEEHTYDFESASTCLVECTRCGKQVPSGKEHSLKIVEEFLGGRFISEGAVKNSCSVCGYVESTAPVGVIIKWLGYSVPEFSNGGTVGIAQGFCVDGKELLAYTNATGKNVEYGVVAAVGTKVNPIGFDGGATTVVSGAIKVDLTGVFCCEIKLAGITDENYDKLLVLSGYISDTEQVTYINNGTATQSAIAVSYNQILNLSDGIVK